MRPTHGRIAVDGVIPFAPSFDVVGWFARDPSVLERVGMALFAESRAAATTQRLFFARDAFELVDGSVNAAVRPAADAIAELFNTNEELQVSKAGLKPWFEVFRVVQGSEIWSNRKTWIEEIKPTFGPGIRERLEWASGIDAAAFADARAQHTEIKAYLADLLEPHDVLCLPTSPRVAPRKGMEQDKLEVEYRAQAMCLLCLAGLGGLPQISLPLASQDGLPLGVSLVGALGADMLLLALAVDLLSPHGS
jgi:amidase